jgi:integrase
MAHIQKRVRKDKDGKLITTWRLRYRDPAGHEHSKVYARRIDAERKKTEVETELSHDTWIDPALAKVSYGDWVEEWMRSALLNLKPKTRNSYDGVMRVRILPTFKDTPLGSIRPTDVQAWVAGLLLEKDLAPASVRNAYFLFSKSMRAAGGAGYLARTPCVGIDLPKVPKTHGSWRVLNATELELLLASVPERHRERSRPLITYGGLRWGEVSALRRRHIDLLHGRIRVEDSVVEIDGHMVSGSTKSGRSRTISVPAFVLDELKGHMGRSVDPTPDALVFTSPQGDMMRNRNFRRDVWEPALKTSGLGHVRIHDLRHTCASFLIQIGAHPKAIQQQLGHASIDVTMNVYGHLLNEHMDEVAAKVDEAFAGLHPGPVGPAGVSSPSVLRASKES